MARATPLTAGQKLVSPSELECAFRVFASRVVLGIVRQRPVIAVESFPH